MLHDWSTKRIPLRRIRQSRQRDCEQMFAVEGMGELVMPRKRRELKTDEPQMEQPQTNRKTMREKLQAAAETIADQQAEIADLERRLADGQTAFAEQEALLAQQRAELRAANSKIAELEAALHVEREQDLVDLIASGAKKLIKSSSLAAEATVAIRSVVDGYRSREPQRRDLGNKALAVYAECKMHKAPLPQKRRLEITVRRANINTSLILIEEVDHTPTPEGLQWGEVFKRSRGLSPQDIAARLSALHETLGTYGLKGGDKIISE